TVLEDAPSVAPTPVDLPVLMQFGFLDLLEEVAAEKMHKFAWGNAAVELIRLLLDARPISGRLAEAIYSTFNVPNNPRDLRPVLRDYFSAKPAKRQEYIDSRRGEPGWPMYPSGLS